MSNYYKIIPRKKPNSNIGILYYEVSMLNAIPLNRTNVPIKDNMRVESFLLHARNLINFLGDVDHLSCSDFTNSKKHKVGPIEAVPNDVIREINERLSHISSGRKMNQIVWNLPLLKIEINKKISEFLDKISPDYFSSEERITREMFNKIIK